MIEASLILNIIVLIPVCLGLLLNLQGMVSVFGTATTAREILLCMYFSIGECPCFGN